MSPETDGVRAELPWDARVKLTVPPPEDVVALRAWRAERGLDMWTGQPLAGKDRLDNKLFVGTGGEEVEKVPPSSTAVTLFETFRKALLSEKSSE